jgi:hypothetical protein
MLNEFEKPYAGDDAEGKFVIAVLRQAAGPSEQRSVGFRGL